MNNAAFLAQVYELDISHIRRYCYLITQFLLLFLLDSLDDLLILKVRRVIFGILIPLSFFPFYRDLLKMITMKGFFGACQLSITHLLPMQRLYLDLHGKQLRQKIDVMLSFYYIGKLDCVQVKVVVIGPSADGVFVLLGLPHRCF